jgi:hypothetical protein
MKVCSKKVPASKGGISKLLSRPAFSSTSAGRPEGGDISDIYVHDRPSPFIILFFSAFLHGSSLVPTLGSLKIPEASCYWRTTCEEMLNRRESIILIK